MSASKKLNVLARLEKRVLALEEASQQVKIVLTRCVVFMDAMRKKGYLTNAEMHEAVKQLTVPQEDSHV